jgi:hypothetical protein
LTLATARMSYSASKCYVMEWLIFFVFFFFLEAQDRLKYYRQMFHRRHPSCSCTIVISIRIAKSWPVRNEIVFTPLSGIRAILVSRDIFKRVFCLSLRYCFRAKKCARGRLTGKNSKIKEKIHRKKDQCYSDRPVLKNVYYLSQGQCH